MTGFVPDSSGVEGPIARFASRPVLSSPWRQLLARRTLLAGALGGFAGVVLLSGCQTLPGLSLVEVIRRLLLRSSEAAFARLTAPGGYWDETVAALGVAGALGIARAPGNGLTGILTSTLFKSRLESAFASLARDGAARAAPLVAQAVRQVGIPDAMALVRGGPDAASAFLRQAMGASLIEAMVPELGQALRLTREPLVGELLASLTGIDVGSAANNLARTIDRAIWAEIGREEAAIRADPAATSDPLLISAFAANGLP